MDVERFPIDGLLLLNPKRHRDERGYFVETYNKATFGNIGIDLAFVQDNQSHSIHAGTIRGLHFQARPHAQAKLIRVLQGSVYDVAVDLRRSSPTYGQWQSVDLSAANGRQFFIPAGFAHAFCTCEPDTVVAYKVDNYYAKDSEGGIFWNDPDLSIDWPLAAEKIHISEKDRELPRLRDLPSHFNLES